MKEECSRERGKYDNDNDDEEDAARAEMRFRFYPLTIIS